jgi:RecB family exonuclease
MRALSHSSISLYLECPQKWKFKYIDKIPEKPRHFFSFGQSCHEALEFFYGSPLIPPSLEEVMAFFEEHWKTAGYKDAKQEAEYKQQGRKIVKDFYAKYAPTYKAPFFVEYPFNILVDGVAVTGKVDRIDKVDDKTVDIVDYKTGKAFDLERVKEDAQLTMYQMAVEELLGMKVRSLTFYHLPSQTPLTSEPHDIEQVKELRQRIVTVASSIQKSQFDPKPEEWTCKWCDYKPHCPVFRHQYLTPPPVAAEASAGGLATDKSEDEILADLVDRYGKMKEQVHELEANIEDLREEILGLLRKKGYLRAFGSQYEASLASEERWEFEDRLKVVEVLKKHLLYDKVLKPSAPEVQKLMKDENLPPEARRDLEKLGKKVEGGTLRCHRISDA